MRFPKANVAGLVSPQQQSEMKSILAGSWPPLKPLPVFKYETAEYRATIDFDKKRGEWVCRKTSLPSNNVQELRGGLREIAMALPHGEAELETVTEGAEPQEQELEKDANRRLQAIHEWRRNYQNGGRYFELRDYLSESQRAELDDSLRLSLTARQLQFNPKNVAFVFDDLSIAGGRFAKLIEFAMRNRTKQGTGPQPREERALHQAEGSSDQDTQSMGVRSAELAPVLNHDNSLVRAQEAEHGSDAGEFPAVSIKNVVPEQDQAPLAEHIEQTASHHFDRETSEALAADSPSLPEHTLQQPQREERRSAAFAAFAAQVRARQWSAGRFEGWSSRFSALDASTFKIAVFALPLLFAVIAFTVGLSVGRGPVSRRIRDTPKSMPAVEAKSPAVTDQAEEATSPIPTPPVEKSHDSAGAHRLHDAAPTEERPKEAVGPVRSASRSASQDRLTSTIVAAPHLPGASTVLVSVPSRGGHPFRVSFPKKAIAATSACAMTSQLSVLVSPEPGRTVAHESVRLEAGELISFTWPRYPRPADRYGSAETIRVRATISQLGQVRDVKFLSGSPSVLPATMRAIRQWRYRPSLLDRRPVEAQQDVTIAFRPPLYSSRVSTQHPPHN